MGAPLFKYNAVKVTNEYFKKLSFFSTVTSLDLAWCFSLLFHAVVPLTWGYLESECRPSLMPSESSVYAWLFSFRLLTPLVCCTSAGHKESNLPFPQPSTQTRAEGQLPRHGNHQGILGAWIRVGDRLTSVKCLPNACCGPASLEQRWCCHVLAEDATGDIHPTATLPAPASSP